MILTGSQYRQLEEASQAELEATKTTEKVQLLGAYLAQAGTFLTVINQLPDIAFEEEEDFYKEIARPDKEFEEFNDGISPVLVSGMLTLAGLGLQHTKDLADAANKPFEITGEELKPLAAKINNPVTNSRWKLNKAIWGEDKRDQIYSEVLKGIRSGRPRQEIVKLLEERLTETGQGGQFYKVERVIDTEYNSYYERGSFKSTKELNSQIDDELVWVRELSSAHKVRDICDDLAGAYSLDDMVPENPHPNCQCIKKRMYKEDYSGAIKDLRFKRGKYTNSLGQSTYAFNV